MRKFFRGEAHLWLIILALVGLLLIFCSLVMPASWWAGVAQKLAKEVGVVIFAVATVSLLYEIYVADKYRTEFLNDLRAEIRKGESNAAACAELGIEEIYPQRSKFTGAYSIDDLVKLATPQSRIRIFARSAHNLMSERSYVFAEALANGAHVQLCVLDPDCSDQELRLTEDVTRHDLRSFVTNLQEQLVVTLREQTPPGRLEVKYHHLPMLDSFLDVDVPGRRVCAWDLSFDRKIHYKYVFRMDPAKAMGQQLIERYTHVWDCSGDVVYEWSNGAEVANRL